MMPDDFKAADVTEPLLKGMAPVIDRLTPGTLREAVRTHLRSALEQAWLQGRKAGMDRAAMIWAAGIE